MKFTVPQFIEHEAKIIGPFTFKQAIVMGGALTVSVILYLVLPTGLFLLAIVLVMGSTAGLIFLKIGGKNLPTIIICLLKYKMSPTKYVWQNNGKAIDEFSRDGIAIGEISFEKPEQIKKAEDTSLNKLSQKH